MKYVWITTDELFNLTGVYESQKSAIRGICEQNLHKYTVEWYGPTRRKGQLVLVGNFSRIPGRSHNPISVFYLKRWTVTEDARGESL